MIRMSRRRRAEQYLADYSARYRAHKNAARLVQSLLKEILSDPSLEIHLVNCRAKGPGSVRIKLYEKHYRNPEREVTDILGVRVITYYSEDVDRVVERLRSALTIDVKNSEDKRDKLTLKEFGYKSVHLQAQTKRSWATDPRYAALRGRWFEIQVRSILEHAWAEIEHEVVYKSGVRYPDLVKRRFARLAGTLELLEDEFLNLRNVKDDLIEHYKTKFAAAHFGMNSLDSAAMIALFEVEEPEYRGWRQAAKEGQPFELKSDFLCTKALRAARIRSPLALRRILRGKTFRKTLKILATRGEEVTHFAEALIAVAITNKTVFNDYFPHSRISLLLESGKNTRRG